MESCLKKANLKSARGERNSRALALLRAVKAAAITAHRSAKALGKMRVNKSGHGRAGGELVHPSARNVGREAAVAEEGAEQDVALLWRGPSVFLLEESIIICIIFA